jgi:nicotinamide-nucleotide amidase
MIGTVEPANSAAILTIGNELLAGDVENTNGSWLARRLEAIGVPVRLIAVLPDDIKAIADFVRTSSQSADVVLVTGGLGGTPDDVTREALAAAFGVGQEEVTELAADLRARFLSDPEYAARWACLPAGSRPLENPLGGAPGFAIGNVYVLPGLPSEMEAMYERIEPELAAERPIGSWRRTYRTRESTIVTVLVESAKLHPGVLVGSYPRFSSQGPEVDVVLKSSDAEALRAAVAWIEEALEEATR